jgi:hypothetical protein
MNLAGLEDKDILQINATINVGALVFLTISAVITRVIWKLLNLVDWR